MNNLTKNRKSFGTKKVLILGADGTGKTYLACALGIAPTGTTTFWTNGSCRIPIVIAD